MELRDGSVNLDTPDGAMRVYEAVPEAAPRGALIVVMEAFGVNAHIEDVTRRAAAAGYQAVAPDLFHRSGGGTAEYGDMERVRELFGGVTPDGVLTDIDAVVEDLRGSGFDTGSIGITGFCWGGWVSFLVAVRRSLGAGVTWYGGGIVSPNPLGFPQLIDEASGLATPWLGLFGDRDEGIPPSDVEQLRHALDTSTAVPHEIVRYAEADHGFHCDGRPAVYHPEAAADGWDRALSWFGDHLTPAG